jgi:hypothetical protein
MTRLKPLSLALSLSLIAAAASAATFVVRPDRDLVQRADAIVVASALTSYPVPTPEGGVETVTAMSIEEVVKGDVADSALNVVEPGGVYKGRVTIVPGSPQFAEGRRVLLFLMKSRPDAWSTLDLVVGKFTFADDRLGQKLLVRDENEIQGWDPDLKPHREMHRSAERFVEYVRAEARGQKPAADYVVPTAELQQSTLTPAIPRRTTATGTLQPVPFIAPYTATSYTMTISGSLGSRWNVFPNGVAWYMGTTQEPGAPGGGATAIQAGIASWDNDGGSNVNYVYSGVDDGTHTQGLHGPDNRNTVLFERDLSAWGIAPFSCSGGGTLGIGGITSASGNNTVGGETFATTLEADVEMNRGLANCSTLFNSGDFNSAVAHELGHTLGFRHADQNRPGNAACTTDASLECSSSAIMTAFVTKNLNAALQTWDVHAVQAVYPGGGTCTLPTVSISASATTITAGQTVTLNSTTTGGVTGYQWYTGQSGSTTNPIGGANGASLTVTPSSTTSYWLRVTNACGSANSNTVTITVNAPPPPARKPKSDFNADGKSDLVLQHSATWGITTWVMNGTNPAAGAQIDAPVGWTPVATGDVDGDGHADVIIRNGTTGEVAVYLMAANGLSVKAFFSLTNPGTAYQVITTADFNHDGTDDIVLQNTTNGVVSVWLMRSGAGTISSGYALQAPDPSYRVICSGDVDADGWPDLILQNTSTNAVVVWRTQNGSVVAGQTINTPASGWTVIACGDVDGDGKDDIILQHGPTATVTVWIMNGFQILNGHVIGTPPATWVVKGRGDFNADGTSDVVLQDSTSKAVYVWLMSGGNVSVQGPPTTPNVAYNLMVNK